MFPEVERNKLIDLAARSLWSEQGKEALAYLREVRGLSDEAITSFKIGYCPERVKHELAGRIITPIFDPYGNAVALSTRHLKRKKDFWHEAFEKSFYLYGLNLAKKEIIKTGKAIVVEGEFDAAYLHSAGIKIAVAVCGSAFTPFHAVLLARYAKEIYIVFDGDKDKMVDGKVIESSGKRAVKRAKKTINDLIGKGNEDTLKAYPVYLPSGYDPDDFVKSFGVKSFIDLLKQAKSLVF